ncbi:MAG TPA: DUF72 domain-containing protein [Ktedonobacterales bacterium]|nr:DUF72 domain-containing protein [Ktedonobacterales bacterium]
MAAATIRVGTASWTDHDPFYPPEYNKASMKSQRISYYARFFSLVEVDSTFYHLQPARNFQMWAERTPDDFVFDVKAYGEMTWHHRDDVGEMIAPSADTFAAFNEMVQPMRDAGKLGALLFQLPPWYTYDPDRLEYFSTVREMLPHDTIAVEFRHRSWVEGAHADETRAALADARLAYCAVDEPQIGSGSVPPVVMVTDPSFSMVRFHGRNARTWYGKNLASSRDRFDYLYTRAELVPWAERIQRIAEELSDGGQVHVVANNNAGNYGIVNALDLQALLGQPTGKGEPLPDGVRETRREREQRDMGS